MSSSDVSDTYKSFVNELQTELDLLDIPLYVFRSDLIFKEFPCVAVGFTGYANENHYMSDQMHSRKKGMLVEFDIGITVKSKDEEGYTWDNKSGIEALVAIVEEMRTILRRIRFKRVYFEYLNTVFDTGIIFDRSSQIFEFSTMLTFGIFRTE